MHIHLCRVGSLNVGQVRCPVPAAEIGPLSHTGAIKRITPHHPWVTKILGQGLFDAKNMITKSHLRAKKRRISNRFRQFR